MLLTVRVFDAAGELAYHEDFPVDGLTLTIVGESREALAREQGAEWTAGDVPFFAGQVLGAVRLGAGRDEIHRQTLQMAMAAWVFDHVYGGLTAEAFLATDVMFSIEASGVVRQDRLPLPGGAD